MNKVIDVITYDPMRIVSLIFGRLYALWISKNKNIVLKGSIKIKGKPIIDIRKGCLLEIGNNVTLTSRNKDYFINMHSPVKLFADRKGAVIKIGENSRVHGTCIHAYSSINVGKNCLIAANCQIIDGNGHDLSFENVENRINTKGLSKRIVIEDNVWIGANSIILPGSTVGYGSVIAANSVVKGEIPKMVLAGGNPAKVIKEYGSLKKITENK